MKNQSEDIIDSYAEPTPYQNMMLAFELIMQAFMTMPAMAYISFALSFLFIITWLINPGSYLSKEESHGKRMVRKAHRPTSRQKQRSKAQTVRQQ